MWHARSAWWLETALYAPIAPRARSRTRAGKTQKFSFLSDVFRRGVWGEPTKNGKEIFGFASPLAD